ncbi:UNVERIFIED_CONTAM: Pyrophosphate--fructose 6-phosphate 1-phosphotransferase subunit beta [Sesamum angustifolium]|uniref:Pyrophosphate--fructose 6-phosphate 1-phosphotransferase subunit beta n=1 Tax=Sesamum angustifolium TaxID=2727405 RepID=A0AAW2Q8D1_9LAMI
MEMSRLPKLKLRKCSFKWLKLSWRYEGRCGLPSNFDATYCYALGYAAGALLHSGKTGLISSVGNLTAPVAEWTVGGTALTSLMDVERRHGKFKPVIKKAMVELEGAPFRKFISTREDWALNNRYLNPELENFTIFELSWGGDYFPNPDPSPEILDELKELGWNLGVNEC